MDGGEIGTLEIVTISIRGLQRRLPYEFQCRCGNATKIKRSGDFRLVCWCGLNHSLRDSERD
jgi:hypothetical protein